MRLTRRTAVLNLVAARPLNCLVTIPLKEFHMSLCEVLSLRDRCHHGRPEVLLLVVLFKADQTILCLANIDLCCPDLGDLTNEKIDTGTAHLWAVGGKLELRPRNLNHLNSATGDF